MYASVWRYCAAPSFSWRIRLSYACQTVEAIPPPQNFTFGRKHQRANESAPRGRTCAGRRKNNPIAPPALGCGAAACFRKRHMRCGKHLRSISGLGRNCHPARTTRPLSRFPQQAKTHLRHARRAMRTPTAPAFFDSPRCEQQIANTRCASAAPMKNATSDFRARLAARQMCLNPGARRLSCRPLLCCATDAARADCDWQPYPSWP